MKRPNEHDYFEFRGNQKIVDYGSADNYIDAQDEYIDYLKSRFPNGFDAWQETHFEIVAQITSEDYDESNSELIKTIYYQHGTGGMYELAKELTDKFEAEHKGVKWGIDDDTQYYDAMEEFLNKELYE